jgi:hypothetical protein
MNIYHLGDNHSLKIAYKNVNQFIILVSYSRPKYIGNMKWLTKITND